MQRVVPFQARRQILQIGHHHLGANPLQTMDTTEESNRRDVRIRIAHRHDMDWHAFSKAGHFAHGASLEVGTTDVDDPGQFVEMRQGCHDPDYAGRMGQMECGAVFRSGQATNCGDCYRVVTASAYPPPAWALS